MATFDEIRPRELKPALLRARRHLARDDRGALPAVPGLRREAERDPRRGSRRSTSAAANQVYSELRALKVDLTFALGGIKNHEIYFEHLGGEGGDPDGPDRRAHRARLRLGRTRGATISRRRASPAAAGRGRPTTGTSGRLFNYIGDAQNTFPVWNATPLVALDVYEHAYFLDYQTDRARLHRRVLREPRLERRERLVAAYESLSSSRDRGTRRPRRVPPRLAAVRLLAAAALRGEDIRSAGSGNIGASNVFRVYGRWLGIAGRVARRREGLRAALLGLWAGGRWVGVALRVPPRWLGHARPVFLRFQKGGKMVATAGGAFFALAPLAALCCVGVWLVGLRRHALRVARLDRDRVRARRSSCSLFGYAWPVVVFAAAGAIAIILLHRQNLSRLLHGTEHRFELRRPRRA